MNTLTAYHIAAMLDMLTGIDDCTHAINRQFPSAEPLTSLIRKRNQSVRDTILRVSLSDVAVEGETA